MIEETARVVKCEGGFAWVETNRKSACDHCSMNKGCGTATLSRVFGDKRARIKAVNEVSAREGESVMIGINESALLKGSLLVYLVPILSLLGFAVLGEVMATQLLLDNQDIFSILFGVFGLLLAMWWVGRKAATPQQADQYQAVILRRLSKQEDCSIQST